MTFNELKTMLGPLLGSIPDARHLLFVYGLDFVDSPFAGQNDGKW